MEEKDISIISQEELNNFTSNSALVDKQNKKIKKNKKDKKNKEKNNESKQIPFTSIFKYSTLKEKFLLCFAIIGAGAQGFTLPLMVECFGKAVTGLTGLVTNIAMKKITNIDNDDLLYDFMNVLKRNNTQEIYSFAGNHTEINLDNIMNNFQSSQYSGSTQGFDNINFMSRNEINDTIIKYVIALSLVSAFSFVASYLYYALFNVSASLQSTRIRSLTFKAILQQEIEWHEKISPGELASRIISDTILIEDGIGMKLGFLVEHVVSFIACYAFAFYYGWILSLEMASVLPAVIVVLVIIMIFTSKYSTKQQEAYAEMGGIAQEAFSQIRTIVSFGTEQNEIDRYNKVLKPTKRYGIISSNIFGICLGLIFFIIYASEYFAFASGARFIHDGKMTVNEVFKVLMCILMGTIYFSTCGSVMDAFGKATGAATKLFEIIDRKPAFDKKKGLSFDQPLIGNIEFKDVHFTYPSRPNVEILKGISFSCSPGQTIALVGASGSGKSTIVQLLERFYDFSSGDIIIDGRDIRDYSIQWLRSQIGLVSQEPTLFDCSIAENIAIACPGATQEQIEEAAKLANAHDFIMKLPNGYRTCTGERGLQLSGGQKQRICIARALINNPKILLLDEATSALDNKSEKIVQAALDSASRGRSTIVIAHRLTTIRNADCIIVMNKGTIVETGNHDELMNLERVYYNLIKNQEMNVSKENLDENNSDKDDEEFKNDTDGVTKKMSSVDRVLTYVSEKSNVSFSEKSNGKKKRNSLLEMDWKRYIEYNKPYWLSNLIGFLGSVANGGSQPAYSFIFASAMDVFNKQGQELLDEGIFWGLMFVLIGFINFVLFYCQMGGFSVSGESLTYFLRKEMYQSIIRQEVGFFDTNEIGDGSDGANADGYGSDSHRKSTGTLTSKLATDAAMVQTLNMNIGTILQQVVTLIGGFGIAFAFAWKNTLVICIVVPFLFLGDYLVLKLSSEKNELLRQAFEKSSKVACEAIVSIKTVYALNLEGHFIEMYDKELVAPEKKLNRKSFISGIGYGYGNASQYITYIIGIYFGSKFMESDGLAYNDMFRSVMAIAFTSNAAGQINTIAPNITKAIKAFKRVTDVLDRQPKINTLDERGVQVDESQFKGVVTFENLRFRYPSRPNITVLRFGHDKIEIPTGKVCAVVGGSGCGKSTLIGLLPRWYDASHGRILVDEVENKNYNINSLRRQIGIVNQEPCLFNISIKENIRYGKFDATDEEIYEAAKKANIHDFIMSLPEKYDTKVGNLGTSQMSGGQKQRIAIARAIVRNPMILLLDEATSALDAESELVVQKALEEVSEGRTTITIAHRLSTIKNADIIVVMKDGYIVEKGNHQSLIEKRGEYYNMILAGDGL